MKSAGVNTRQTIWDPLRKKEVALTPEERVRQWFIGVLSQSMGVPMHLMMSEAGFKLGEKQFRADILPEVELSAEVLDQAIRYNMVLNVKYIMITNGAATYIAGKEGERFVFLNKVPSYNEMSL